MSVMTRVARLKGAARGWKVDKNASNRGWSCGSRASDLFHGWLHRGGSCHAGTLSYGQTWPFPLRGVRTIKRGTIADRPSSRANVQIFVAVSFVQLRSPLDDGFARQTFHRVGKCVMFWLVEQTGGGSDLRINGWTFTTTVFDKVVTCWFRSMTDDSQRDWYYGWRWVAENFFVM